MKEKAEIRKHFRTLRRALTSEEVEEKSKKIAGLLFSRIPVHRYSVVHIFLPIKRNNEPETFGIIETLRKDFPTEIYISKSLENGEMLHVPYTSEILLERSIWGIEEPADVSEALSSEAFFEKFNTEDILVLIPLLAFDHTGNRVGYGKGYYDRFLAYSDQKTTKVGLSLLEPVDQISDAGDHDIKLDYAITPDRIYQMKR
jgi:5-formyltetrahydrofolate cyclo-ligase